MTEIKADVTLDVKGLASPILIDQTKKEMESLQPGQVLEVLVADQDAGTHIKAWVNSTNDQFIGTLASGDLFKHYIRKAPEANKEADIHQLVLNNADLEERMNNDENLIVIDVREEAEYQFGHIPQTVNIPLGVIERQVDQFNKDEPIYLICRSGNRSDLAAKKLTKLGFTEVYNVVPGMSQWTGKIESI